MVVPPHRRASLPWLLTLCAIVALFGAHAGRSWSFTVDDAAITFAYARNLADGHGLVLNAGGERVEGATNLLWTLLLAGARWTPLSHELLAKILGVSFAGLALVGLALFPSVARGREPRYFDLLAPLLVSLMPHYSIWAPSGLENGLYAFLTAGSLLALAREERDPERFPWSAVALWLLFATRPDGALYAVAVGLAKLLRAGIPRPRRQDALWALTLALGAFSIELFRLAYFAWPAPNSVYAKTRTLSLRDILRPRENYGWYYLGGWLWEYKLTRAALFAPLALLGPRPHGPRLALLLALASAFFLPVYAQGDWMGEYRFLTNGGLLLALALAEAARGAHHAISRITPRSARPALRLLAAPVLAFVLLKHAAAFYPARFATALQHNTLDMRPVAGRVDYFALAARKLGLDGRRSLLDSDIGGSSYDGRLFVVDMVGLADVGIARAHPNNPPGVREVIFDEHRPDFVRLHGPFYNAFEFSRLEELSALYLPLPNTIGDKTDSDSHFVRRELVAAPYVIPVERVAPGPADAPDAVTFSHHAAEPGTTVLIDLFLQTFDPNSPSSLLLSPTNGASAIRVPIEPLGGLVPPNVLLAGERPRARVRLAPPAGRFTVQHVTHLGAITDLGELDVRPGAGRAELSALASRARDAVADRRFERCWSLARTLRLRAAAEPNNPEIPSALAPVALALAHSARALADAGAYELAAGLARQTRGLMDQDPQVQSLLGSVGERLADAARDAERDGRIDEAFERARDAVLVDPRRSWSRRRAETLRPLRFARYDGGLALAAYRAAAAALARAEGAELDRAMLFMGRVGQSLEASRLAERAGHTPRDPHARLVNARGLLLQGRAREALALVSGVPCGEARDPEVTLALRTLLGARSFRPDDARCVSPVANEVASFNARTGSFESDRWAPWIARGDAWLARPGPKPNCGAMVNGWRGQRYAHSVAFCSDRPQGTLRSPAFIVRGEALSFLVGGGSDAERVGVRLLNAEGRPLLRASGANHEGLRRVFWDLRPLRGQTVSIEVYDRSSDEWGHILADDFRDEPVLPDGIPADTAQP
jgi:hypothetical protein